MNQEENVGGQALIEGVMMRGKNHYTLALRKESGEIKLITKDIKSLATRWPVLKSPFLRGVIALFESMAIGIKSLIISANEALPEEEKAKTKKAEGFTIGLMVIFSLVVGMGIFVAIPNILTEVSGIRETETPILFNLIAGLIRMMLFVGYVFGISLMKDVRRVFEYHGAEHKAVNTYEAGQELTLDNAVKFTTYHPRCGTSFMFFVFFISIFVFSVVPVAIIAVFPGFKVMHDNATLNIVYQKMILIPSHILLLPVVASVSYEVLKLSFKKQSNIIVKWISRPGYYIQKLTTKEPDESQLEVALAALNEVVHLMSLETETIAETVVQPVEGVLAGEAV